MERPPALVEAEPQPKRHVRRSQKPVPKVPGQLRLVAGGACIPAPSKVGFHRTRLNLSLQHSTRVGARSDLQHLIWQYRRLQKSRVHRCSCCQRQV